MTAKKTTIAKKDVLFRTNTRIRMDQQEFIKKEASKRKISEGEMNRLILDEGIKVVKNYPKSK